MNFRGPKRIRYIEFPLYQVPRGGCLALQVVTIFTVGWWCMLINGDVSCTYVQYAIYEYMRVCSGDSSRGIWVSHLTPC